MCWFPSRALLSVGVIAGLVAGCARSRGSTQTNPPAGSPVTSKDTLRSEDIDRLAPGQPIEQVLQGRFPGVEVARTSDGGVAIRIRGASSFYANTQPLYVLDGVPIQPGPNGSLTGLNPHDVASITVLKNPSDTAIYGIRGANGVIVITTKRPGH